MKTSKENPSVSNHTDFIEWINDVKLPTILRISDSYEQNLQAFHQLGQWLTRHKMNRLVEDWKDGDVVLIVARPASGKSDLAVSLAKHLAVNKGVPVAFFSLEHSREQLFDPYPPGLYVDDTPHIHIQDMTDKIYSYVHDKKVKAVFIDYLQLIDTFDEEYQMDVDDILALRHLAIMHDIVIVATAQQNSSFTGIHTDMASIYHLESDKELAKKNDELLREWESELGYKGETFAMDGFFPVYSIKGGLKILFIGREALEIKGSIINYMYDAFLDGKTSSETRGFTTFYRRLLKFAYGLIVGVDRFDEIPDAREVATWVVNGCLPFAFANLSKVPNSREEGRWTIGEEFRKFNDKKNLPINKKYWQKQIELLQPDIIIAFGLENYLHYDYENQDCIFGHMDVKKEGEICNTAVLSTNNGFKCYYLDPPHLSATRYDKHGLSDEYFFTQLKEAVDYVLDHPLPRQIEED